MTITILIWLIGTGGILGSVQPGQYVSTSAQIEGFTGQTSVTIVKVNGCPVTFDGVVFPPGHVVGVSMGAFVPDDAVGSITVQACLEIEPQVCQELTVPVDSNADGRIGVTDLVDTILAWGRTDIQDVITILEHWDE
jgi:hypothetical protein